MAAWSGQPVPFVYFPLLLLCSLYAGLRGGAVERTTCAILVIGTILTAISGSAWNERYRSIEWGLFAVDVAVFIGFAVVALFSTRFWPIWVAAMQLDGVMSHLSKDASPTVMPWAYQFATKIWAYGMIAAIMTGVWRHRRRLARFGRDPSWRIFSPDIHPIRDPQQPG